MKKEVKRDSKSSKKSKNNKSYSKKSSKKDITEKAIQDFEVYAKGVKRLQELEKELEGLDTSKFKSQERNIRSKLNKVHLIPEIEFDLKQLKEKIVGLDHGFEKDKVDKRQTKQLQSFRKKSDKIEDVVESLKKKKHLSKDDEQKIDKVPGILTKLGFLKKEIQHLEHKQPKKQLSEKELEEVKGIPHVKNRVSYIRRLLDLKEEDLEKEINKLKRIKKIKQLTKKEVKEVKSIPNVKNKITYLRDLLDKEEINLQNLELKQNKLEKSQKQLKENEANLANKIKNIFTVVKKDKEKLSKLDEADERLKESQKRIYAKAERAQLEARKKQLSENELKQVKELPIFQGKISGIKHILTNDKKKLQELEEFSKVIGERSSKALRKASYKQLSKEELKHVDDIPELKQKISSLKESINDDKEKLKHLKEIDNRLDYISRIARKKQLSETELKDVKNLAELKGKLSLLETETEKEEEIIDSLQKKVGGINFLRKRIKSISSLMSNKSEEIAKEEGDIELIKKRLTNLKKELEKKAEELEQELKRKTSMPSKNKILHELRDLNDKMDSNKQELYDKLTKGISDSRWDVQKEKELLRKEVEQELGEVISESKGLIEQQAQEINEQLMNEVKNLNERLKKERKEMQEKLLAQLVEMRQDFEKRLDKNDSISEVSEPKIIVLEKNKPKLEMPKFPQDQPIENQEELVQPFVTLSKFTEENLDKINIKSPKFNFFKNKKKDFNPQHSFSSSKLPELPPLEFDGKIDLGLNLREGLSMRLSETPNLYPEDVVDFVPELRKREEERQFIHDVEKAVEEKKLPTFVDHNSKKGKKNEDYIEEVKFALETETSPFDKSSEAKPGFEIPVTKGMPLTKEPKIKKEIFLELEDFHNIQKNVNDLDYSFRDLSYGLEKSTKGKGRDREDLFYLIQSAQKMEHVFSDINKSIFGKIDQEPKSKNNSKKEKKKKIKSKKKK